METVQVEKAHLRVRSAIDAIRDDTRRNLFRFAYLAAARVDEVVSEASPLDGYKGYRVKARGGELAYGLVSWHPEFTNSQDVTQILATLLSMGKPSGLRAIGRFRQSVAVFQIFTLKRRETFFRAMALPVNPVFEPWTQDLVSYFSRCKKEEKPYFPFTRQQTWRMARGFFSGIKYVIPKYTHLVNGVKVKVPSHMKPLSNHGLRHFRRQELRLSYGFTFEEANLYGGWTLLSGERGGGGSANRYEVAATQMLWKPYIAKLFKPRSDES